MRIIDIEKKDCTGCMSCYNICPSEAIEMKKNNRGFLYPEINENKCIECGLCYKKCPITKNKKNEEKKPKIYAAWVKEKMIRRNSTSGGLFYCIAKKTIENGGVVFGAILNEQMKVVHSKIESVKDLQKLQGSKYVQSYIGNIYKDVRSTLEDNKEVIFSGTPCQIAGLKKFLGKEYKNLILIDIVCHGVPSPLVFEKYVDYITNKYKEHGKIVDIKFRYKKPNWTKFSMKICFDDGFIYCNDMYHDYYLRSFLENFISRESCHNCKFTTFDREGDITLADFWSYISESFKYRNTNKGISLILVNTDKGEQIINDIKTKIVFTEKNIIDAKRSNKCLYDSYKENARTNEYWKMLGEYDTIKEFFENFFVFERRLSLKYKLNSFYRDHAYILPKYIKEKLNNYIDRNRGK